MNKKEFLTAFANKLKEEMNSAEIESQIKYYADYIAQEMQNGKTEEEVLESLGDPVLLARTILDTRSDAGYAAEEAPARREESRDGMQIQANTGCIIAIVAAVIVLLLVLWLVGSIFRILSPILIPIILVSVIASLLKRR